MQPSIIEQPALDAQEATPAQLLSILKNLRALVESPGWVYIVGVLRSQAHMRFSQIGMSTPEDLPAIMRQAHERGEAGAMLLLAALPENLIGMIESDPTLPIADDVEPEELSDAD